MKEKIGFDHIIGQNNTKMSPEDLKIYQRIIKAHSEEQSTEDKQMIQHISLRLEMEGYLKSKNSEITPAGLFLERLLKIYDIKKSAFAKYIEMERTNFYALLKGRRKFNTDVASKVGETFKIDPQLWLFIEAKNEMKEYECESQTHTKQYTLANLLNER
jgi:plasmid maintenance system antidote protein VapI